MSSVPQPTDASAATGSSAAYDDIAPSDAVPSEVAAGDVGPSDVAPSEVAAGDVGPSEAAPESADSTNGAPLRENVPPMSAKPTHVSEPPQSSIPSTIAPSAGVSGSASASGSKTRRAGYEKFKSDELAIVMSHFDVGPLTKIREFPRGSRKAPKLLVKAEDGRYYLLKRRARGKDDPYKVAFCHQLQMFLADQQFPLPHLIGTRNDNNSMLVWNEGTYELFEFIKGTSYETTMEQTGDSGKILALFHKLLLNFESDYKPPQGSYHGSRYVTMSMDKIPTTLSRVMPDAAERQDEIDQLTQFLHGTYASAMLRVNDAGLDDWPKQIVHSDWHPGNMLFRGPRVVAVIDYDAARIQQRIVDISNGALQFSILGGGEDPSTWPDHIDEERFKHFVGSYDNVPGCQLSKAELRVVPWLMIEALIAESAIPIANTGSFSRMAGVPFLAMVERKVRWLQKNVERLGNILG